MGEEEERETDCTTAEMESTTPPTATLSSHLVRSQTETVTGRITREESTREARAKPVSDSKSVTSEQATVHPCLLKTTIVCETMGHFSPPCCPCYVQYSIDTCSSRKEYGSTYEHDNEPLDCSSL